jgi:type VI secretion system ImpC/EvpB family protein
MDRGVATEPPVEPVDADAAAALSREEPALAETGKAQDPSALRGEVARLIVAIDALIGEQLDHILHHPRFQAVEALWRGVAWLNETMAGDPLLKLRILDLRWSELERDFDRAAMFDRTILFEKVYNGEFGRPGGEPFGLLVIDQQVHHLPAQSGADDIAVLAGLAEVAAAAFCPIVMGVDPRMVGLDGYDELDLRQDVGSTFQTANYSRFDKLRAEPDTRFLACALPRLLMRQPHRSRSFPRFGIRYDERVDEHRHLLWGSAGFGLASVAARAMRLHRWPANIRGAAAPNDGGIVDGPERLFLESDKLGVVARFPTENAVSESQEVELNQLGLTALRQCHLTGSAAFFNVPSLHQPPAYDSEMARVNARIGTNLHYILCVSRFAHYIKVIAREWVGRFRTAEEARRLLENWIQEYVTTTDDASPEQRARYPLGEASVEVSERPDAPGSFDATVLLRPHFQLDQLSSEFQLTTPIGHDVEHG